MNIFVQIRQALTVAELKTIKADILPTVNAIKAEIQTYKSNITAAQNQQAAIVQNIASLKADLATKQEELKSFASVGAINLALQAKLGELEKALLD